MIGIKKNEKNQMIAMFNLLSIDDGNDCQYKRKILSFNKSSQSPIKTLKIVCTICSLCIHKYNFLDPYNVLKETEGEIGREREEILSDAVDFIFTVQTKITLTFNPPDDDTITEEEKKTRIFISTFQYRLTQDINIQKQTSVAVVTK